jgi:hypothetical protein
MCLKFWVLNEIESPFILIYECFMSESIMCINIWMILYGIYKNFTENLNRTIRKHKSKDKQYMIKWKREKRHTPQKTKEWATRIPQKLECAAEG